MKKLPWTRSFSRKTVNIFSMANFTVQNYKAILTMDPELWAWPILGPKWPILPKQVFFGKKSLIFFIYLLAPFTVQNFKKILRANAELWRCAIFEPKMTHLLKQDFFFKKPVTKPCSFHSCFSTFQKKSFVNLLMKYWQLKNTET